MAGIAGMAEKSGKSGEIFFWSFLLLGFCIGYSVSGQFVSGQVGLSRSKSI